MKNTRITTFNVASLYTSIPQNVGIEATNYLLFNNYLTNYQSNTHPRFKKEFILESVKFILKNNTFRGRTISANPRNNKEGYLTLPTHASLTMGYLEITLHRKIVKKLKI